MSRLRTALFVLGCVVTVPTVASAQATLAGVVRDTSGGVLPGATVEASSPVLIERSRTAVTDNSGQYRITELPPGRYTVTFSLAGFSVVRREGVELSGSGVVPVNVELRLGALEESITVTGETPIVDVQSIRRETVLNSDTLSTLPVTRTYGALLSTVPGLMTNTGALSAMTTPFMTFFTAHGGRQNEGRVHIDGLPVAASFNGGGVSTFFYDVVNAEEMQVLVSGGLGESEHGGPSINLVPRSGGNTFRGSAFYSGAGSWSQSDNIDDRLRGLNPPITRPPALVRNYDVSGSVGGPILRDRLWFFGTIRDTGNATIVEGAYGNRHAGNPARWDYARDQGIETRAADRRDIFSVRLTAQASERNRVSFSHEYQRRCSGSTVSQDGSGCRTRGSGWIAVGNLTSSPESWPGYHDFPYHVTQATWSSPLSSRILLEAGFSRFYYLWAGFGTAPPDGLMDFIPVSETSAIYGVPNFNYRGMYDTLGFTVGGYADNEANPNNWRASASYITGAHNMKVGYSGSYQISNLGRVANNTQMRYIFNSNAPQTAACSVVDGIRLCPVGVGYSVGPRWEQADRTLTHSLYVQDQWTRGRVTLQGALRYDRASSWAPADGNGTTLISPFNPQPITFERTVSVRGFNDITPRVGLAWDVLGTGKTALKLNVGKYLQSATNDSLYTANNPAARIVKGVANRAWTDVNGNFQVDCVLLSTAANGECGPLVGGNLNFGNPNPALTVINPDILGGWGVRPHDWQFGLSVQQEVLPRVSVDVGYNRRWFGNFFVTDNLLVGPEDYERWTLTAPQHPGLPGGGGYPIDVYTLTAAAAARGAQNLQTFETDFGPARTWYWHGVDVSANARVRTRLTIQAGTSTGRGVRNTCETIVKIDSPDPRGCDVTEPLMTSFRGLAAYTVPKVDVLVSAQWRSLNPSNALPGLVGEVSATNGASLNATAAVPNTLVQQLLGRLPPGGSAAGTTTVNLVTQGQVYPDERVNQVDMRFAKIIRFGSRRADIAIDLYNVFNTNHVTGFQQTFDWATTGATWLQPTAIVAPRFARFNVTFAF